MVTILNLLKASDRPAEDWKTFLKAQILFWLIGAPDGHAKNFSLFLGAGGRFALTPLYDVLTAQPLVAKRKLERKRLTMAMSVGDNNHYRMDDIQGRHFIQTARRAGLPDYIAEEALQDIAANAQSAFSQVEQSLPPCFPEDIHNTVIQAMITRLRRI